MPKYLSNLQFWCPDCALDWHRGIILHGILHLCAFYAQEVSQSTTHRSQEAGQFTGKEEQASPSLTQQWSASWVELLQPGLSDSSFIKAGTCAWLQLSPWHDKLQQCQNLKCFVQYSLHKDFDWPLYLNSLVHNSWFRIPFQHFRIKTPFSEMQSSEVLYWLWQSSSLVFTGLFSSSKAFKLHKYIQCDEALWRSKCSKLWRYCGIKLSHALLLKEVKIKGGSFPGMHVIQYQPCPLPSLFSCPSAEGAQLCFLTWLAGGWKEGLCYKLCFWSLRATCTCAQHTDGHDTVWTEHLQSHLPISVSVSLYLPFSSLKTSPCLQSVLVSGHRLCKVLLVFL